MSRPISDAQLYFLLAVREKARGHWCELHMPPALVRLPDRRVVFHPPRIAMDRPQLLGLGRRGMMRFRGSGIWEITDTGLAELSRPCTVARIEAMVAASIAEQQRLNAEQQRLNTLDD